MTSKPNTHSQAPASREPSDGLADEDSVPQDDGTDNSWQMEPLENPEKADAEDKK